MTRPLDAGESNSVTGGASFSLANRMIRAAWTVVWLLLAAWTPPPLHGWRRFLLRCFGARIAGTARVYGSTRIWLPSNLTMGEHAIMGPRTICYSQDRIVLEDYANVAQGNHLCAGTHDIDDPRFQLRTRPIRICSHAWLAADTFVGPGVTVGEGAVLGGRGVTFRDLEPWTVYSGNPAREIKKRKRFA